jgi:hypothetical protein
VMLLAREASLVQSFATKLYTAVEMSAFIANVLHRSSTYSHLVRCHLSDWTVGFNVACNHGHAWVQVKNCPKK